MQAEIEIRKVLGQKVRSMFFTSWILAVIFILMCAGITFGLCKALKQDFYDSWASSLGEVITSFIIFMLYCYFVKRIYNLLQEIDLDLV